MSTQPDGATDGRSSRWDEHRAQRREQLIDAAILAVKQYGTDVGMDQIAATARTSKPVVYRYFADKGELYRAMGERIIGVILSTLRRAEAGSAAEGGADGGTEGGRAAADPRLVLRTGIDAYLGLLEDNPELFRFVTENRALHEAKPGTPTAFEYLRPLARVLGAMLGEHLRDAGLDPGAAQPWGEAMVGFVQAASLWWIEHPTAMDRATMTDYLTALLWGGVAGVLQSVGLDADARPSPGIFAPIMGTPQT